MYLMKKIFGFYPFKKNLILYEGDVLFEGKKILAIIPARGGSKGIPNKNIVDVLGKPLISFTIEVALDSRYIDKVVVSTDDKTIAEISSKLGAEVPFLRPDDLARDESKVIDSVIYTIDNLEDEFDYVIVLQPTQPIRKVEEIDEAIKEIISKGVDSLVSVSKVRQHPILMKNIDDNGFAVSLLNANSTVRRQDFSDIYIVNGSLYINKINTIDENTSLNDNKLAYIMDYDVIDIDTNEDLKKLKRELITCLK